MPKTEVKKVVCLKCGKTTEVKLSTSINAAEDLNMRRELLSGRLFHLNALPADIPENCFILCFTTTRKTNLWFTLFPMLTDFRLPIRILKRTLTAALTM